MKRIAILIGALDFGVQAETLKGVCEYAENEDVEVFAFTCNSEIYGPADYWVGEHEIFSLPGWDMFDGIIFLPNSIRDPEVSVRVLKSLETYKGRFIIIDKEIPGVCSYTADNAEMMRIVTRHVMEEHTPLSVMFIGGPVDNIEAQARKQGFIDCMYDFGLEENSDYFVCDGNFWIDSGQEITEKYIIEHGMPPAAIICANDYMAIGALDVLKRYQIPVPIECLVAGFDNCLDAVHYIPRISSIGKPYREMGRKAAEAVLNEDQSLISQVFDGVPVFSESCGCALSEASDIREFGYELQQSSFRSAQVTNRQDHLFAGLLSAKSGNEYLEMLKSYIVDRKPNYFSFCICTDPASANDDAGSLLEKPLGDFTASYSDFIRSVIYYSDGQFEDAPAIEKEQIIPFADRSAKIPKDLRPASLFVLEPVHFMDKTFGYIIVGKNDLGFDYSLVHRLAVNLGSAMMVLKRFLEK